MNRTCPDCGAPIEADERFCGDCGAYLDWSEGSDTSIDGDAAQEAPEAQPAVPPAAEPEPEPAPAPAPSPASALESGTDAPTADEPQRATVPATEAKTEEGAEKPGSTWQPPPVQAQTLLVPVERTKQPKPQQPAPQKPGAPAPKPRRRRSPDSVPIHHGDLICGDCGAGNKPTRKFCRRCGHDLKEAEVAKIPWWRRIFQRRRRVKEAGDRPRTRRRIRVPVRFLVLLALLAALVGGGYAIRGYATDAYDRVLDRVVGVEKTNPPLSASSSMPGHDVKLARDGHHNLYWAPAGEGRGEWLRAKFKQPVRLVYLLITPGASGKKDDVFLQQGRPERLRARITRADGKPVVQMIDLEDEVGAVEVPVRVNDVTGVTLQIRRTYAGKAGDHIAIGELEFFVRK